MRVAVIGAGVIGVTTAYELAADGHQVVVFERRSGVAAETSFANAGIVAPGYLTPWAAPGMPGRVLRQLLAPHAPVRVRTGVNAAALRWMWRWWRACQADTFALNRQRLQRLAVYSHKRLHTLTHELHIDHERAEGCLVLLRTPQDLALMRPALKWMAEGPTRFKLIDAQRCRTVEPGLNPETPLHAGIYLPDDEVSNCRQFTMLLRQEAQRLGADFRFHTEVLKLVPGSKPAVLSVQREPEAPAQHSSFGPSAAPDNTTRPADLPTPQNEVFDAVVVCAAMGAPALLRPHGLKLPLQAVHGYSVTAPLRQFEAHPDHGPRAALIDERYKVAISRIGSRIRVAGGAEIGGSNDKHNPAALATLYKVLDDWFPGAARLGQALPWKGARPMLPDGPPVMGASGIAGVWLNLGHGSSGWTLACGSARVLADAVTGRPAAIDTEGLGHERLRG
jgi:D-amino-acid dehydrogenase